MYKSGNVPFILTCVHSIIVIYVYILFAGNTHLVIVYIVYRNAKRWDRPSFSGIAYFLKQSDSILRAWSEEDLKIHPQVNIIGADPGIGLLMYSDLQNIYYTENL